MKLMLLVYFASIVENISVWFVGLGVYFIPILIVILCIMHFSNYGEKTYSWETETVIEKERKVKKSFTKICKIAIPILTFLTLVGIMLPNQKTVYLMAGAYATEQVIENPRVQKIGKDVLDVIEGKLAEEKQPLNKENK